METQQDTQDTMTHDDWIQIFTLIEKELVDDGFLDPTEARFWKTPKYVNNRARRAVSV